jgi:hypothetical protein
LLFDSAGFTLFILNEGERRVGKKRHTVPDVEPSLLPSIGEREAELKAMLLEAQAEAERAISEAKREAAALLEAAMEGLPRTMEGKRKEALARIETEISGRREALEGTDRIIERRAEKNIERAASLVVSAVWPGGE